MTRAQRTLLEDARNSIVVADRTRLMEVRETALSSAQEHLDAARALGPLTGELAAEALCLAGDLQRRQPALAVGA